MSSGADNGGRAGPHGHADRGGRDDMDCAQGTAPAIAPVIAPNPAPTLAPTLAPTRTPVSSMLETWRAEGSDHVDPMRFRLIEALDRRATAHAGDARRMLDERLAALAAAYADEIGRARVATQTGAARARAAEVPGASATLRDLVDTLKARAPAASEGESRAPGSTPPDFPMLDYFRETWSKVSAEKQLRDAYERVPGNAGPLNSSSLVHRSLALMRELSPGYLQQFLSYIDALAWMEQLAGPIGGAPVQVAVEPQRPTAAKKGARGKSR